MEFPGLDLIHNHIVFSYLFKLEMCDSYLLVNGMGLMSLALMVTGRTAFQKKHGPGTYFSGALQFIASDRLFRGLEMGSVGSVNLVLTSAGPERTLY